MIYLYVSCTISPYKGLSFLFLFLFFSVKVVGADNFAQNFDSKNRNLNIKGTLYRAKFYIKPIYLKLLLIIFEVYKLLLVSSDIFTVLDVSKKCPRRNFGLLFNSHHD